MTEKFPAPGIKRFHRLQWKLTISYLVTSVIVLCLLELLVTLISLAVYTPQERGMLENRTQNIAHAIGSAFPTSEAAQRQQFQALWELQQQNTTTFSGYIAAIDVSGRVLTTVGDHAPTPGQDLLPALPVSMQRTVRGMLSSRNSPQHEAPLTSSEQGVAYVVAPLLQGEVIKGAIIVSAQSALSPWNSVVTIILFFGVSLLVFFIGSGTVGLVFGVVMARGLVHRLQHIATAVNGWSQGDFSVFAHDPSNDELGELTRRLNQMAQQLQHLLRTRQDLATLEERNRLARDLHDSVKQQVFAVSLHLGTSRALLGRDEQTAQAHLVKAEGLIHQAQRELTTLIQALRPVELEGRSLAEALQDYTHSWQEQTGIHAELQVDGEGEAPEELEHAFFRIAQEGLANIARHSQAQAVQIHLTCDRIVTLSMSDNGRGFDAQNRDHRGFGLSSMRERIQALGGHMDIQSEKGKGTMITVWCDPEQQAIFQRSERQIEERK